jgi:hypothetical protein
VKLMTGETNSELPVDAQHRSVATVVEKRRLILPVTAAEE